MFCRSIAKLAEGANTSRSRAFDIRSSTNSWPLTTVTAAGVFCRFSVRFSAVTTTSSSSPDGAAAGGVRTSARTCDEEILRIPRVERQDIPSTRRILLISNSVPLLIYSEIIWRLANKPWPFSGQSAHFAAQGTIAFAYVLYRQYQLSANKWGLH